MHYTNTERYRKEKAWRALSMLYRWQPSQQKIFHRRQFLATQISSYGALALDLPQLKPGPPVSTHTVYWPHTKIQTAVRC